MEDDFLRDAFKFVSQQMAMKGTSAGTSADLLIMMCVLVCQHVCASECVCECVFLCTFCVIFSAIAASRSTSGGPRYPGGDVEEGTGIPEREKNRGGGVTDSHRDR